MLYPAPLYVDGCVSLVWLTPGTSIIVEFELLLLPLLGGGRDIDSGMSATKISA